MSFTKWFFSCLFSLITATSYAGEGDGVTLSGELGNCAQGDSLRIYGFLGSSLQQVAAIPLTLQADKYYFNVNITGISKGFYFLGFNPSSCIPMILGADPQMHLIGDCKTFAQQLQITGSVSNKLYNDVNQRLNSMAQRNNELMQYFRQIPMDMAGLDIQAKLQKLDVEKKNFLDSVKAIDPFIGKVVALKTYRSYQYNKRVGEEEEDYFSRAYFEFVDFRDPDYQFIPQVREEVRNYAGTLGRLGLSFKDRSIYCDRLLKDLDQNSRTYATILAALIEGFQSVQEQDCFNKYANIYLQYFANLNPMYTTQVQSYQKQIAPLLIGAQAPDIKLATPDGSEFALSQLKGKVVMVDFWASWCKPCRKENPKVVAMYNKLKPKGLEILSVSLDQSKDPWVNAIQQDNLAWYHISDLKGWQCAGAKLYGVSSVPYTVVVDKEGKIIDKNLRGARLERVIEEALK